MRMIGLIATCLLLARLPAVGQVGGPALAANAKGAPAAEKKPEARPMKIAYLDLTRVLKGYERSRELNGELNELRSRLRKERDERVARVRRYEQEIEQLVAGSPERLQLEDKRRAAIIAHREAEMKAAQDENRSVVVALTQVYNDVWQEVQAIARERDLDMVIKTQSPEGRPNLAKDLTLQISLQFVLYSKAEHDLTADIVKRLNEKRAAARKRTKAGTEPDGAKTRREKAPEKKSDKVPAKPSGKAAEER